MIRPEAKAILIRWREVLIGAAVLALGLYWIMRSFGLLFWVGFPVALAGAALVWTGVQRGAFRQGDGGPGVVQVVEGRISYFGPLTGGAAALTEISGLRLDPTARPAHWVVEQPGEPALFIPTNAEGADALFDVFATLPGLDTGRLVSALRQGGDQSVVIWRRHAAAPVDRRLH